MQPPSPGQMFCLTLLGLAAIVVAGIAVVMSVRGYPEPEFLHVLLNPRAPLEPVRCPARPAGLLLPSGDWAVGLTPAGSR